MKYIFRVLLAVAALALIGCEEPDYGTTADTTIASLGIPPNNEIWFLTNDNKEPIAIDESAFDVEIEAIEISEFGINSIRFTDALTTIGDEAFYNCHNLFNVSLPNSVATIGDRAFAECKNMECLTLGDGLRNCGIQAFDFCGNLYSLHIPSVRDWCHISFASQTANPAYYAQMLVVEGLKVRELHIPSDIVEIHDYAFTGITYFTSVTIPASVRSVGKRAFEECSNISKVVVKNLEAWCSIEFEDESANPLSIAGALYSDSGIVTNLTLTSAKEIKSRNFIGCSSLKSLTIGDTTEQIAKEAFRGCIALTTLSLGANVKSIGDSAFMGCRELKSVTCYATEPPLLGNSSVFDYNAENRKIYVPSSAVEEYKSATYWGEYAESIEPLK